MIIRITDRQAQIAEMLQQKDFLNVEELAKYFQVTTQTIRFDLNVFCDRGVVRYCHRGVERRERRERFVHLATERSRWC